MFSTLPGRFCRECFLPWYDALVHLLPCRGVGLTVRRRQIILAIYYTLADIVLLGQCFYYRGFTWRDEPASPPKPTIREPNERTTLLPSDAAIERRGSDWTGLSPAVAHVPEASEPRAPPSALQSAAWNATLVVMVCAAGVLGWFLSEKARGGKDNAPDDRLELNVLGQVFGYLCAVAYIASRMPQLVLNWRRKTTDGLSMLFFLFACLGNVMYVLSIVAYNPRCPGESCAPGEAGQVYGRNLLINLSWLAGSLVTLLMDLAVFAQHFAYRTEGQACEQTGRREGRASGEERWDRPLLERSDTSN